MGFRARIATPVASLRATAANPVLVRLVGALGLRWAGMGIAMVAYLVVAYDAAGTIGLAEFGVVRMIPAAIAAALAGRMSHSAGAGRLIVVAHLVRAGAAGTAAAALTIGGPIAVVFGAAGVSAAAGALVRPLHTAILPELATDPGELVAANVASGTAEGLAALLGPAIGGLLVATAGPAATIGVAAVVALAAAGLLASAGMQSAPSIGELVEAPAAPHRSVALAAVRDRPGTSFIIVGFGAQTIVRGLLTTLIVVSAIDLLGLGDGGVGSLNTAVGAGGIVGAIAAIGLAARSRLAPAFAVALTGWGIPIALIGAWPITIVAFVALGVVGFSNAALDVAGYTLLQRTIPAASRVAVLGFLESIVGLGVALGAVFAPPLINAVGTRGALGVTGAILPIVALVTWPRLARADRNAVIPSREIAALARLPLFRPLPPATLEDLARCMRPVRFAAGDYLMREGEPGDRYLVIDYGLVEVTQDGRFLRTLGPGEGLGEIALLRPVPRTATVRAVQPTTAYELGRGEFICAVTGDVRALAAAEALADQRLVAVPS